MSRSLHRLFLIGLSFALSACGIAGANTAIQTAAAGGLGGGLIGAGTGAIVGSIISNGDRSNSALLGAGIGTAVGATGAYFYKRHKEDEEIEKNNKIAQANYDEIVSTQAKLDALRHEVQLDTTEVEPSNYTSRHYLGSTVGY